MITEERISRSKSNIETIPLRARMVSVKTAKEIIFPPFRLDLMSQQLRRNRDVIPLRPKALAVLQYLSERPQRLVSKDELLDAVWPEVSVSDAVLKVCVREIREALGDDPAAPRFVETAHRRGYRFIAPVRIAGDDREGDGGLISQQAPEHSPRGTLSSSFKPSTVVGREAELAQLQSSLMKALEGERQVVFVTGEAGIGKTTLVEAFVRQVVAADVGIRIARGQCLDQYGAGEAYLPVLEALSRLCREPEGAHITASLRRHAPVWLAQMPSLISSEEREALQQEILGATRERMLREMSEAVEAIAREAPLVLVLEDLHWSDYSTLDLISSLARRREPARLLLVATYRPVEVILNEHPLKGVKQELQVHRQCAEVPVEYLTESDVSEYLATRFPDWLFPGGLAQLIHQRTGGNPLFMVNAVDYLVDEKIISGRPGGWELRGDLAEVELGVPENIRRLIEKQIERLGSEEQRLLEAASVVGMECSAAAIAAGLDEDVVRVEELCEELARRRQFLLPRRPVELPDGTVTPRYKFIHVLYVDVLYSRVSTTRRALTHRRIAERGEAVYGDRAGEIAVELAIHFERARDWPRAAKHFQQAAENAARRSAHHEAASLSEHGLELLRTLPESHERDQQELALRIILGLSLIATKGFAAPEVERTYGRARELCQVLDKSPQLPAVLWGLWVFHLLRAEIQAARELAEHLLQLSHDTQEPTLPVQAHWALGATYTYPGEFVSALEHCRQALALYEPSQHRSYILLAGHDPGVTARCFAAWDLWSLGYPEQALDTILESLTLAGELSHPQSLAAAQFFTAFIHYLRRESGMTLEYAETVVSFSKEHGLVDWMAFGTILIGWAQAEQGDVEEGIERLRQGLAAHRATGAKLVTPCFLSMLAEALGRAGDAEEGLAVLADSLSEAQRTGDRFYEAELYRLRGELLLLRAKGGPANRSASARTEAEACFRQAIDVASRQRAKSLELRAAVSLSRLCREQSREETRPMLDEIYGWFTEGLDTVDLREARALTEGAGRG